jgi:hypothetical protein
MPLLAGMGERKGLGAKTTIYIGFRCVCRKFIADIFLCLGSGPFVSDDMGNGLVDGFNKIAATEGIGGYYSGFAPTIRASRFTCINSSCKVPLPTTECRSMEEDSR